MHCAIDNQGGVDVEGCWGRKRSPGVTQDSSRHHSAVRSAASETGSTGLVSLQNRRRLNLRTAQPSKPWKAEWQFELDPGSKESTQALCQPGKGPRNKLQPWKQASALETSLKKKKKNKLQAPRNKLQAPTHVHYTGEWAPKHLRV